MPGNTETVVVNVSLLKQKEVCPFIVEIVPVGAEILSGSDSCKLVNTGFVERKRILYPREYLIFAGI